MPAVKQIAFSSIGGPLVVDLKFPGMQVVSYTLTLFEAKSNSIVLRESGNNVNAEEDRYHLPTPASTNDGRLLQIDATFVDPAGKIGVECEANVTVFQDNNSLGTLTVLGTLTGTSFSGADFVALAMGV